MPVDLAEPHTSFFRNTSLGLTGPPRTRGLSPPFGPEVGGVCPRKSTAFFYFPRVTILSPHLTEIISLHDHLWQPHKQLQTHLHVTVYNSPNSPRAEQPANNRQLRVVAIDFFGKYYTKNETIFESKYLIMGDCIPKHTNICKLDDQTRRNTTAVGGRWYNTWYQVSRKHPFYNNTN